MDIFDIITLAIALVLNITLYTFVYIRWRIDCKEIGKDQLAVPLKDRMQDVFIVATLPSVAAFCIRK